MSKPSSGSRPQSRPQPIHPLFKFAVWVIFLGLVFVIGNAFYKDQAKCSIYSMEDGGVRVALKQGDGSTVELMEDKYVINKGGAAIYIPILKSSVKKHSLCLPF